MGGENSFNRWQAATIAQFTHATNLILGLAVGALGFQVTQIQALTFKVVTRWDYSGLLAALAFLFSVAFGIWLVVNRLLAFRGTAKVARLRGMSEVATEIEAVRASNKVLDNRTWMLLWLQVATFSIGVLCAAVSIAISTLPKIGLG